MSKAIGNTMRILNPVFEPKVIQAIATKVAEQSSALIKLSQAEKWLSEAKDLTDLKEIHDIAVAAEAYAKAHKLGIDAENHAREIKFYAARKMGELMPATPPEESGKMAHKKVSEKRTPQEKQTTLISKQRLSEFRNLAKIPIKEFKERIEVAKVKEEKITYNKLLRGDWYQMSETPEWETPQWLFDLLDKEFHFTVDVCASEQNYKCKKYYSKANNGLKKKWTGVCWMNPPYGREIKEWMQKARVASENGATVVCLVPARPDTEWWWENCIQGEIRFIRGRLQWPNSDTAAPFPSAVVLLDKTIKKQVVWWNVQGK
jgi:phage N-6-adenine-methyltransferase